MPRSVHPDQLLTFVLSVSMRERTAGDVRGFRPSRALPWGSWFTAFRFFRFYARTRRRGMREGSDPLALSRGAPVRSSPLLSFPCTNAPPGVREDSNPLALSRGAVVHCFPLLSFPCANAPPGDARGFRPSRALPWGCGSQLSTSFASPRISLSRVSPYSSGTRTVSDWGGTIRTADSFFGCAESRFAERKSVWVTASGRVTRISRSAERL